MKIKTLTCAQCGSDDVDIELPTGEFITKDFVIQDEDEFSLGYYKGQVLSFEKLKYLIETDEKDGNVFMVNCSCNNCRDEQDVNIELDNGTTFTAGTPYFDKDGNEINTIFACFEELIKQASSPYLIFYIDQDEPVHHLCECFGLEYKKGNAFYEVTKTEKVSNKKEIIAQRKDNGSFVFGDEAKIILGIELRKDFKFTPKKEDEYKLFVQTTSNNRILKDETFMIYKNDSVKDNTIFFYAYIDEEPDEFDEDDSEYDNEHNVIVVLGTQKEIDDDALMGIFNFPKHNELSDALDDDGSLCEHYLFKTNKTVVEAKNICLGFGLVENPNLKDVGWA